MAAEKKQRGYATNLASEFYVLSALYRLGLDANLTLGNRKAVDIVVSAGPGKAFTIEVKAVAGKNDWLVGRLGAVPREHHYVVLVGFEGEFDSPGKPPAVWVFKHSEILPLIRASKTGNASYISRKQVREGCERFKNKWETLANAAA